MRILGALAAALPLLLMPAPVAAQDFPTKPIKLIVPFPPGGPNDIIARVVGQRMTELTKQPIIIENRSGQAGVLGTDAVAKATPDGYTIGIVSASALVINPFMEKTPYDVNKDIAPVTLNVTVPEMLVVASNVPANNMAELIALAKAQPGKLNFASAGIGGLPHLAGELFKLTAKIDIVHVPYRGAAPASQDLVAGHVSMLFDIVPLAVSNLQSGKVRALAVCAPERVKVLPDVPTIAEAGLPGMEAGAWFGLFAPAGTPPGAIAWMNGEAKKAFDVSDTRDRFAGQGALLPLGPPEAFGAHVAAETERWGALIRRAGIKVE